MARRKDEELVRYRDCRGKLHRVVLRAQLALDLCRGEPTRVVCELSAQEGTAQARAVVFGSAIDEGYLARARREPRPFIRPLTADDLREGPAHSQGGSEEPDEAADGPPLAA